MLAQLQILIIHTNLPVINCKVVIKINTSTVEDFLDLVLDAHVVAAAADFCNLPSINAKPTDFFAQLTKGFVENRWDQAFNRNSLFVSMSSTLSTL